MHKKLELFRKSTHTTMLNPNLSSENCGKKIQSDRPKKWSKITILSPITFWENSRSWSWSDLRSLFEQVILMWSKITKKVIGHYFGIWDNTIFMIFGGFFGYEYFKVNWSSKKTLLRCSRASSIVKVEKKWLVHCKLY